MQCKNDDNPPQSYLGPDSLSHSTAMMACTTVRGGSFEILYMCSMKKKKKKIGKWRPDMTFTGWGFSRSVYHNCQFCQKTLSLAHHLQSQFIAKAIGLRRSVISPPLSGSRSLSQSWLWLALSALSELRYTNTSGVREFKIVWNFPSLSR